MSDDLKTTDEMPDEMLWDETSNAECLNALAAAYGVAESMNDLTPADEARQKRIKRKTVILIDKIVGEIYDQFRDGDKDKDEDE